MDAKAATVLDRVPGPLEELIDAQTASSIVDLKLDQKTRSKIDALAGKSANGTLAAGERQEYLEFVEAIDLLSIFQAKARDALNRQSFR